MRTTLLILFVFSCTGVDSAQGWKDLSGCPPVTVSSPDQVDNGIVRVTYTRGVPNPDQLGAHRLERMTPSGWSDVGDGWYHDWTFWVSPFRASAVADVIEQSDDHAVIAYRFDHQLDYPGSQEGGCYLHRCGLAMPAVDGTIAYPRYTNGNSDYSVLKRVTLTKLVRVERCAPGYYVGYHTDPPLFGSWVDSSPEPVHLGEREFGLGWLSETTWASTGAIARNPEAGGHRYLGLVDWIATIAPASAQRPYVQFLATEHRLPGYVWQFAPTHYGVPLIYRTNPQMGRDGRPEPYQLFRGAVPYMTSDRTAEPSAAANAALASGLSTLEWP